MKVLIIAAHPDDEVLGCAGAIIKNIQEGKRVSVCILTDGAITRYKKDMVKILRNHALKCAKILGGPELIFGNLPNQLLDTLPITEVIKTIEKVINSVKPDIVYTHDKGDLNRDHKIVYEATLTASRPIPGSKIKSLLTYFVPSSSEFNNVDKESVFVPNVFLDIKNEVARKIRAFSCYQTEIKPYPHPRSPEAIKTYAQWWGIQAGIEYAEPYRLIRTIT